MGFLKFDSVFIDFLAWPLIALCYPLYSSIRAIETGSKNHMRKLVIYWTVFSLISLFEFAFMKIIERIPFWSSIRYTAMVWLVMPQFNGACYAYEILVHPVLSVNLQSVIDKFYKRKKDKPHKSEAFLDLADKYIKENGSEALEMLIASKHVCKEECNNLQRDTQVLETEEENAESTSKWKEPDGAQDDNEMIDVTEKSVVTEVNEVKSPQSVATAGVLQGTGAAAKFKDMTPPEASAQNRRPETPPLKKAQQEWTWTCDLCKVTSTNEKTLNAHLQGSKHKSKCESLKASKLHANDTGATPLATGKSNQGSLEAVNNKVGQASHQKSSEAFLELAEKYIKENGSEAFEMLIASKHVYKEECNNLQRDTQILETEEKIAAATLQREEPDTAWHDNEMLEATKKSAAAEAKQVKSPESVATAWVPEGTGAAAKVKDMTPPEASAENRRPETPPLKKPQQEWTCDLCKVTATSEKTLNAHLQGSKHKSKCETQKESKLHANDRGSSPLATGESNQGNLKAVNDKVGQASQQKSYEETQEYYAAQHENEMLEATKKSAVTEAKQVQSPQSDATVCVPKGTDAATKVKDMTPPDTSAENRRPETPPLKKAQQEWTCDLFKVSITSEKTLNAHLQGSKHQSNCESLKASKLHANDTGATPLTTDKSNQGNLEAVNNKIGQASNQKSSGAFLEQAEKYIKENGCEAFEMLITSKHVCKEECNNMQSDTQVLETEEKNAAAASKQKEPDTAQHYNEMLEATRKSATAEAKQVQSPQSGATAGVPKGTGTAAKVKDMTPLEASVQNRRPETPPLKKAQQEWTCDLCKVTTTNEKTLNAHLQGSKHKSKRESLKASMLHSNDTGATPLATGNSNQGNLKAVNDKVGQAFQQKSSEKTQESDVAQHENEMLEAAKKIAVTEAKQMLSPQSDATVCAPEGTGAAAKVKDMTPLEASAQNRSPETPALKKAQQEWTCDLCKVTTTCEKNLNAHLQGSKHKSKCESLKASMLHANDRGASPSATGKSNQSNVEAVNNKVGQASQQTKSKQDGGANKKSSQDTQERVKCQVRRGYLDDIAEKEKEFRKRKSVFIVDENGVCYKQFS